MSLLEKARAQQDRHRKIGMHASAAERRALVMGWILDKISTKQVERGLGVKRGGGYSFLANETKRLYRDRWEAER